MLTDAILERILDRIPGLTIGVLGDLFLDRYLDIDASLNEPSLETTLDAYQVVRVRSIPGAAGTVINNLIALGVKQVRPFAVLGDDGEGYELRQALRALGRVEMAGIFGCPGRRTPTYTKPMLQEQGQPPRELNRLDIKNRSPLPAAEEQRLLDALDAAWPRLDALIVLDQVSEAECGVVTTGVRQRLAELAQTNPGRFVLADSRERIGQFRGVALKPNRRECIQAIVGLGSTTVTMEPVLGRLAAQADRPVFCTAGEGGIWLFDPGWAAEGLTHVPAYPVQGPIDVVGAGDSTSAGITCAVAAGASLAQAAAFGNLVASITIQQIGTTGTASPSQVRARWSQVRSILG